MRSRSRWRKKTLTRLPDRYPPKLAAGGPRWRLPGIAWARRNLRGFASAYARAALRGHPSRLPMRNIQVWFRYFPCWSQPKPHQGLGANSIGEVVGAGEIFGGGVAPALGSGVAAHFGIRNILRLMFAVVVGIGVSMLPRDSGPSALQRRQPARAEQAAQERTQGKSCWGKWLQTRVLRSCATSGYRPAC
jgi:hypothetical protein